MFETPVWDINKWLSDALAGLGLTASEEPFLAQAEGENYITWQQGVVRNKTVSGRVWSQSAQVTVWLWAKDICDWQAVRQSMVNALMNAGAKAAKPAPETWIPEISRRQVPIYVLLQRRLV